MLKRAYVSSCPTSFTRTGKLDMQNRKPYRTASQKFEARKNATLVDGRYVSQYTPVSYHRAPARGRTE